MLCFVLMAAFCPRPYLEWNFSPGSWTVGLDFPSGDGILPLTMGPEAVAPEDLLLDFSSVPTC